MITQENQTGKKPGEEVLKVKQIYYEKIEIL